VLIVVYFAPLIYGKIIVEKNSTEQFDYIRVGIIQPNFDPWEKWGGMTSEKWDSYLDQFNTYINETKLLKQSNPEIVFWPETAIPFHFLLPRYSNYLNNLLTLSDTLQLPIFTGFPMVEYFNELEAPVTAERLGTSNIFVESYNSTILIKPRRLLGPIHRKTILVPFAERIPYAETFRFLIEPLKWNVGISSWGKGGDTIVYALDLHQNHNIKFSGMICYESAYPDYVRQFVKHGAEFLVIITNDSWWGNTSGAYQHASFASLRAVETRRWIVQCANGGISMVVDPTGAIRTATKLFTRTKFVDDIGLRKDITFVVEYGDIVAHICLALSLLIIVIAFLRPQNINKDKNGNN
jgi:apolipoprotein N-acyltransferase